MKREFILKPSLSGFIKSLTSRFRFMRYICSLESAFSFLVWIFLSSLPRRMELWFPHSLMEKRRVLLDTLFERLVFKVNGVKYTPLSFDKLPAILPEVESWMWKYLKLKRGDVFLDIGAHIGKYALWASKKVGKEGLVVALEPHPENFKALIKGAALSPFKNIIALNLAAWNKECKLPLFISESSGEHSLKLDRGLGSIEVQAKPLDKLVKELNLKRIDWVKIDVEGAWMEVLEGMKEVIKKNSPKIIVEVWKEREKVIQFLELYNYRAKIIDESYGEYIYFSKN